MTATVTRGGAGAGPAAPARRAPRRRQPGFPRASTTPGKVRLIRAGLVLACLAWGALAALMVSQHASAAGEAAATSEPLSLAAQQMYQSLADADVTASTGYLYGRTPPFAYRQRYQRDIAAATADLKAVTAASGGPSGASGGPSGAIGASLGTLSAGLPVYTGYVEDGQAYNSLGNPAGGSFLEVASEQMHLTLLPAARDVYAYENARLAAASARATGHGSTPAETLAQADIAALRARGDETLNLISRTGDTDFQADFGTARGRLSTLLASAASQSTAGAVTSVTSARQDASSWFAVNQQAQKLDKGLDYGAETRLVIGSGPARPGRCSPVSRPISAPRSAPARRSSPTARRRDPGRSPAWRRGWPCSRWPWRLAVPGGCRGGWRSTGDRADDEPGPGRDRGQGRGRRA